MCENFHNETMCLRQKKSVPILRQARKMGENASKNQAIELLGEKKKSLFVTVLQFPLTAA